MNDYQAGDKIEFMLIDEKAKKHWFPGLIHGVKRTEDPATNSILSITYLVDTGRNVREDVGYEKAPKNHKGNHVLIGEEKHVPVMVRQPEQLELTSEFIRPRE